MSEDQKSSIDCNADRAESLIEKVRCWADLRDDIRAVALVGSYARGDARSDSDIDLVLMCSERSRYLSDTGWLSTFGEVVIQSFEDWGKVQSIRVVYRNGPEVEFGVTGLDWAAVPVDGGTAEVLRNGCSVLLDRDGRVEAVLRVVHGSA